MPRLNIERTNREILAPAANAQFVEEHFPWAKVNDGWAIDEVEGTYSTKVYGHGVVTTEMDPPFRTTFQEA